MYIHCIACGVSSISRRATFRESCFYELLDLWFFMNFVALGILCEQVEQVGVFVLRLWRYSLS